MLAAVVPAAKVPYHVYCSLEVSSMLGKVHDDGKQPIGGRYGKYPTPLTLLTPRI